MTGAARLRALEAAATEPTLVGYETVLDGYVSHEMAVDACEPDMEGMEITHDEEVILPAWRVDPTFAEPIIAAAPAIADLIEAAAQAERYWPDGPDGESFCPMCNEAVCDDDCGWPRLAEALAAVETALGGDGAEPPLRQGGAS